MACQMEEDGFSRWLVFAKMALHFNYMFIYKDTKTKDPETMMTKKTNDVNLMNLN